MTPNQPPTDPAGPTQRVATAVFAALTLAGLVIAPPAAALYLARSADLANNASSAALGLGWLLLLAGLAAEVSEVVARIRGGERALPRMGGPVQKLFGWLIATLISGLITLSGPAAAQPRALSTGDPHSLPTALPAAPAHADIATAATTPSEEHDQTADNSGDDHPTPDSPAGHDENDLPEPTTRDITVEAGDSFWELAEQELAATWGRAPSVAEVSRYWHDYVDTNRDHLRPPGDPDVIHPGQQFTAPAPPADPEAAPVGAGEDDETSEDEGQGSEDNGGDADDEAAGTTPGGADENTDDADDADQTDDTDAVTDADNPEESVARPAPGPSTEPTVPPTSALDPQNASETATTDDEAAKSSSSNTTLLTAGGMALAGTLLLLHRRRRAQQRHRHRGDKVTAPSNELTEAERALVHGADEAAALRLDATLRAAAAGCRPGGLAPLAWVEASPQATMLVFDSAQPAPGGFRSEGKGWFTTAPAEQLDSRGADMRAPAPTLVPVGATGETSEALIELEAAAVTVVDGPFDRAVGLLRSIALSAATSPWAEQTQVLLVGLEGDLTSFDQVSAPATVDAALDRVEAQARHVEEALAAHGYESTSQARAESTDPDAWRPLVVINATRPNDPATLDRLRRLAELSHRAACVVTLAPDVHSADGSDTPDMPDMPGRRLVVHDATSLRVDGIDDMIAPYLLDDDDARRLVRLLDHSAVRGDDAYTAATRPARTRRHDDVDEDDTIEPQRMQRTRPAHGGIDELLEGVDVLVRVLGQVEAVQRPGRPAESKLIPSRHKALEAIAYLAAVQEPVPAVDLERSLFPNGARSTEVLDAVLTGAATLLGNDLAPIEADGAYAVPEQVTTDYALFAELAARAEETDDAKQAALLLTDALELVRDEPFAGVGKMYSWVGPHRGMIVAEVVDAAEELAETRLSLGDWRSAEWAARQGLRAMPTDERLYRLLMRSTHASAAGPAAVGRVYQELNDLLADKVRGVGTEDSLHSDTVSLYAELTGRTLTS